MAGQERKGLWWAIVGLGAPVAMALAVYAITGGIGVSHADGWWPGSSAQNEISDAGTGGLGGISNTRHNLTMTYNGQNWRMDPYRNNYVEVCVYCHTPHGGNKTVAAPLWNRTTVSRQYDLYNKPTVLGQPMSEPGPNSLTCLSCHDGFTAIDSIINMPTKSTGAFAGFSANQQTSVGPGFLDSWGGVGGGHVGLAAAPNASNQQGGEQTPCYSCHKPQGTLNAPDFGIFVIGQNFYNPAGPDNRGVQDTGTTVGGRLADDHPIGVTYPDTFGPGVDYKEPTVKAGRIAFFDRNGNNHADPNEVRLYDTGDGYEVECGSCHDPHGVKVAPDSNRLTPSFLRVGRLTSDILNGHLLEANNISTTISGNAGSELCLTCHVK